jgi:hypothetical protein
MNPIVVAGRVAFFGSRPEELFGHMAGVKHDRVLLHDVSPASRITLGFKIVNTSPSALARNHAYASAVSDRLRSPDAIAMLKSLPIPVIAVPWFQSRHLPDLLIVAHEVGHHVEDLGLTSDLLAALAGVPHAAAWKSWAGEIFADVFATLACGPGFTTALIDFLATSKATITAEWKTTGAYPTAYLRILVSIAALNHCGFATEAKELKATWQEIFPTHAMTTYEPDCALVAEAILDRSYRRFKLPDLIAFGKDNQEHAKNAAAQALDSQTVTAAPEVRELASAAALAFAGDPVKFHAKVGFKTPQDRLVEQIERSRASGTRSGADAEGPQVVANTRERDTLGGAQLFETLLNLSSA